jgi:hypothetical protein
MNKSAVKAIVVVVASIVSFVAIRFFGYFDIMASELSITQYVLYGFVASIIAVCALLFGPLVGGAVGFFGELLVTISLYLPFFPYGLRFVMLIPVIVYGLYGFVLGKICETYIKKIDDENMIQKLGIFAGSSIATYFVTGIIGFIISMLPNGGLRFYGARVIGTRAQFYVFSGIALGIISLIIVLIYHKVCNGKIPCFETEEKNVENMPHSQAAQNSMFDGGVLEYLGINLLGCLLIIVTLGLASPVYICWIYRWQTNHSVIEGRRLKFHGTASGLFGTWLLCLVLTIITLGIYGFWVPIKLEQWKSKHITFAD